MGFEIVTLIVGPMNKVFSVHKTRLCDKIDYFEKMFKGGFKESLENTAEFPEDDTGSFNLMLEWVYFDTIRPLQVVSGANGVSAFSWNPILFYKLAQKLCISKLQNLIMDVWKSVEKDDANMVNLQSIGPALMEEAYKETPHGSGPRRYTLQALAHMKLDDCFASRSGYAALLVRNPEVNKDFLSLLCSIPHHSRVQPPLHPRRLPDCHFHVHGRDPHCPVAEATSTEPDQVIPTAVKLRWARKFAAEITMAEQLAIRQDLSREQ